MTSYQPSLWRTMVTAFLRTFAGLIGLVTGLILALILLGILFSTQERNQEITPAHLSLKPVLLPDAEGQIEEAHFEDPLILQLSIRGIIGSPGCDRKWIDQVLVQMKRAPFHNRKWAGILLVLTTPGGTADDSAAIYHRLMELKQELQIPCLALVQGLCASGGMYIAAAADQIVSEPDSIVGSVGVLLGPTFNLVGGMDKLGIQAYTLTEGIDKDVGNPFRPWRPDEFSPLQGIARSTYAEFVRAVVQARPQLTEQILRTELGARIFYAQEAVCKGLIDSANSSRKKALQHLSALAQVSKCQVVEFQAPFQLLEEILGMGSQTLYRMANPWKPSWSQHVKGPFLLISPALAGD